MSRKSTRIALVLLVALIAVLSPLAVTPLQRASAQTNVRRIELTGTITAMAGQTITVRGRLVDFSTAEIKGALAVGRRVKVEGMLLSNGVVRAREVRVLGVRAANSNANANANSNMNSNQIDDNANGNFNGNSNDNGDDHGGGSGSGSGKGGKGGGGGKDD